MPAEPPDPLKIAETLRTDLEALRALVAANPRETSYAEAAALVARAVELLAVTTQRAG